MDHFYIIIIHIIITIIIEGSCVKIIAKNTIFPCLDSYDLLITDSPIKIDLIRIYTTPDKRAPFRHFKYISEVRLNFNNLVKIDCNYFNPENRYYCFSVLAFGTNKSITYFEEPLCKATLQNDDDHLSFTTPDFKDFTIIPSYGLSFQLVSPKYNTVQLDFQDLDEKVSCKCNQVISINISNTSLMVQSNECSENESKCSSCVLNLTEKHLTIAIKIVRIIQCDDNNIKYLIVRDGSSFISPRLDIAEQWIEYKLNSSYLLFESPPTITYIIGLKRIIKEKEYLSIPLMHIILLIFIVSLFASIIILVLISCLTKKKENKVQILLVDDGPNTCTSYLNSSLDQFSFADAESMEMDYYDYNMENE